MRDASSKRALAIALGIFALALAVRLLHIWQIRHAPFFALLMGDSRAYDEWARRIAGGEWIGRDVFYQAPLYPYFLAVVYRLFGRDLLLVRVVQSLVGSASCVLVFLAGRRLFSERVGVLSGGVLALWAPAIFFDGLIQKSVLDVFFVCAVLALLAKSGTAEDAESAELVGNKNSQQVQRSPRFRFWYWALLGIALGALALTRENALVFIVVVAGWTLLRPYAGARIAALAIGLLVTLGPVALRNAYVGDPGTRGFFITTAQFGPNFYIGNNAHADGTYQSLRYGRGAPEYERQDATELAERAEGRTLSPGEVSAYWSDQAVTFITSQPAQWLRLVGRKFLLLWNATEMVDTESQETHAEWSWPLRVLGPLTHFGTLVPLALFGAIVTWRCGPRVRLLLLMTGAYAASVLAFYVFARYRYPLVPMLVLFASAGCFELQRAAQRREWMSLAALVAVAVFANWPVILAGWQRAVSENNIGVALQAEGRIPEAVAHYERAAALRPNYAPAINNLGTALRAAGHVDAAIAAYERAIAAQNDYPEAHYNLANALTDAGRAGEAVTHFQFALRSLQGSADVHNNLGIALASQNKFDEAIAEFRQAVRADPRSAKAHRNLADLLLSHGSIDEGLQQMREAASLVPGDGGVHYDLGSALLEAGRADEAVAELRQAIELLPQSAEAHNNLGIAFGSLGRIDEAIAQFREALRLKPDFGDAKRNLEMATAARRRSPP